MIHVHQLDGCSPTPLAHYLKALGILRLVAEQVDCDVRGWWDEDRFRLATKLDRQELEAFFLHDYKPTPFVSPWNRGAGFFLENDRGVSPLEKSTSRRFAIFRSGIEASRLQLEQLSTADRKIRDIKAEAKKNGGNERNPARSRNDFEEDYKELICSRDQAQEKKDHIPKDKTKELEKARKQLQDAEALVEDADKYRILLDVRDAAETEVKEANDQRIRREANDRLKDTFSKLKTSKNYKRRLRHAEKRFKHLKAELIPNLRLNWRGAHREWMDAAMVLEDDGTPKYPALLGPGGNDGNFDFTNNFMQRVGEVFDLDSNDGEPKTAALAWVSGALWGIPTPGNLAGQPVGQYLPGTAGGANNSNGPDSDSMVNPVDFILMLEGTVAFTSHVSRRFISSGSSRAASPFVVDACGAAYASASADDKSLMGEQWMPLWSQPSSYTELRRLLAEGRAQIGTKFVREPLDLALAVRRLGTARGIKAFQRYGYIERNGRSNLAVPLGRFDVMDEHSVRLACIDDLTLWLLRLRRDKNVPARLATVEKRLADALFATTERPHIPGYWQRVLMHLAEVEGIMACGSGFAAGPVPHLRPEWIAASDDGTPEFRLAISFALQARSFSRKQGVPNDSIRRHWLPLDREQLGCFATTSTDSTEKLDVQPDVVMHGRRGLNDAIALVERRLVEASQQESRHLPLKAAPHAATNIADLTELLSGSVDLDRTLTLARAYMALDCKKWYEQYRPMELPRASVWPDEAWIAIRLCLLPGPLETSSGNELNIASDPAIFRRLTAGDASTAIELALRRLRSAGVCCTVRTGTTSPKTARLWAAALAFPISQKTTRQLLGHIAPQMKINDSENKEI